MFFREHTTISIGGARALEIRTTFVPSMQSSSAEKPLSTTAPTQLFSQREHTGCTNGFLNASHSFSCISYFGISISGIKKNTEYIIEMRDAVYVLRDAGQSSQFSDCPTKCGMGGHPTRTSCLWRNANDTFMNNYTHDKTSAIWLRDKKKKKRLSLCIIFR